MGTSPSSNMTKPGVGLVSLEPSPNAPLLQLPQQYTL